MANCRKEIRSSTRMLGILITMDIQVGDILKLKKQHPCGSHEWEVLRIGADFRLKCKGCSHQIMIARRDVEKNVKNIQRPDNKDN